MYSLGLQGRRHGHPLSRETARTLTGATELIVHAAALDPRRIESALFVCGAQAVSLLDDRDDPIYEPEPGSDPLWPKTRVVGLFPESADPEIIQAALAHELGVDALPPLTIRQLAATDWRDAWREGFGPRCYGNKLWVCPFDEPPPEADARVLWIEPGLAFGTGTHESTALCLRALAARPPAGERVLDYGCGSGILALAALRLGARHATALDRDPQALSATEANARRNEVIGRLHVTTPERLAALKYDVIVANILADTLIDLRGRLARLSAPGGRLLLAGVLSEQRHRVAQAFANDFEFASDTVDGGWVLLDGRRRQERG